MIIVKVGGSLFDLPGLKGRLTAFLGSRGDPDCLLVPGGGAAADAVRRLDRDHGLGPEASHWLALRACSLNAHFLRALLPEARVVPWPTPGAGPAILDPLAFALADAGDAAALPACWEATSDSVAARAAAVSGADLVLLKSVTIPPGVSWQEAARAGYVDGMFADLVARHGLRVRAFNWREERGVGVFHPPPLARRHPQG